MQDDIGARVKLKRLEVLSQRHYTLRNAHFAFRRHDGVWQEQSRESYDPGGDGAAVLPFDRARNKVLLVRQFRWPVFEAGRHEMFIEAVAGKLDDDDPETCARREAQEEAGLKIGALERVTHCFSSPGAVKERLSLFLAAYDSAAPRERGGGHEHEGEDIEVLELTLDEALAMIGRGEIADMKTIILLQAAKLSG
jgi:nudix-type nucleoside diphosphatase (YffH/AdpP family)